MRILVINPNSDEYTDNIMKEKIKEFVKDEYEVAVKHVTAAPKLVTNSYDAALGMTEMVEMVKNGEEYDAFVTACHGDPNLDILKSITDKPVVGIAQASMKIASMLGNSFAVVSPSLKSISPKRALARKYHCEELMVGLKVSKSNEKEDLLEAAQEAVKEFNVDSIVLGCANYSTADKFIEKELGITVLDGLACSLFIASGLVKYNRYKKEE